MMKMMILLTMMIEIITDMAFFKQLPLRSAAAVAKICVALILH